MSDLPDMNECERDWERDCLCCVACDSLTLKGASSSAWGIGGRAESDVELYGEKSSTYSVTLYLFNALSFKWV